jgi:hypothetical protein
MVLYRLGQPQDFRVNFIEPAFNFIQPFALPIQPFPIGVLARLQMLYRVLQFALPRLKLIHPGKQPLLPGFYLSYMPFQPLHAAFQPVHAPLYRLQPLIDGRDGVCDHICHSRDNAFHISVFQHGAGSPPDDLDVKTLYHAGRLVV